MSLVLTEAARCGGSGWGTLAEIPTTSGAASTWCALSCGGSGSGTLARGVTGAKSAGFSRCSAFEGRGWALDGLGGVPSYAYRITSTAGLTHINGGDADLHDPRHGGVGGVVGAIVLAYREWLDPRHGVVCMVAS